MQALTCNKRETMFLNNLHSCMWDGRKWTVVFDGALLPSPGRACPDTEGGGVGLGGKSDIMPCNLFLRFSEPGKRRKTQNIQSCRGAEEGRRRGGEASRWTEERETDGLADVEQGHKLILFKMIDLHTHFYERVLSIGAQGYSVNDSKNEMCTYKKRRQHA